MLFSIKNLPEVNLMYQRGVTADTAYFNLAMKLTILIKGQMKDEFI